MILLILREATNHLLTCWASEQIDIKFVEQDVGFVDGQRNEELERCSK